MRLSNLYLHSTLVIVYTVVLFCQHSHTRSFIEQRSTLKDIVLSRRVPRVELLVSFYFGWLADWL
jgi:hypothetical protein